MSMFERFLTALVVHVLFPSSSTPPNRLPPPPTRANKLLSPVSPGIPLRTMVDRKSQYHRDQAWVNYSDELVAWGDQASADSILQKLEALWDQENPEVDLPEPIPAEAREWVEGEYVPPPPKPETDSSTVPGVRCHRGVTCMYLRDCASWQECLRKREQVEGTLVQLANGELTLLPDDLSANSEVIDLCWMLNRLKTLGFVVNWSLDRVDGDTAYPDGYRWNITMLIWHNGCPDRNASTVTRFPNTRAAIKIATDALAECEGDEPETNGKEHR